MQRAIGIISYPADVLSGKGAESNHKKSTKETKVEVAVPIVRA